MKKILVIWLLLVVFIPKISALSAEAAVVIDADSGRVLFGRNENKEKLIASTTKIMTAVIAFEYGDPESVVTIDESILKAYGSAIYIQVGEEIKLKDLVYGLMLRSGNDAAIAIANHVAGSLEAFVLLMNERANDIKMTSTKFLNPHGLEENSGEGNTSTAKDMALLMRYAMQNDQFKEITGTKSITVKSNYKTYVWQNKNKLLNNYDYTTGGKTGYTEKAKRTLVTSATKDDKNLVVVTLNDGNDFNDHESLYNQHFEKYQIVSILDKETFTVEDHKFNGATLFIDKSFKMLVTNKEQSQINIKIKLNDVAKYDDYNKIGIAEVYLGDKLIHEESMYIKKDNTDESPSFWQKFISWFKKW